MIFVGNVEVGFLYSVSNDNIKLEVILLMAGLSGPLYQVKGVLMSRVLVLRL